MSNNDESQEIKEKIKELKGFVFNSTNVREGREEKQLD
jgi:hypothetical protein